MAFLHVIADFNLQGVLAKLKVKTNDSNTDYIGALLIHGYSWSFMVHLPTIGVMVMCDAFDFVPKLALSILVHAVVHAIIDTCKANHKKIGLIEDQLLHLMQIHFIWVTTVIALIV